MLKIKSVEIKGFKADNRSVNLSFSNENISVVYGKNGCGKTTLLRIIYAFLSQNESILFSENVQKMTLNYELMNNKKIKSVKTFLKKNCIEKNSEKENIYDWEELEDSELTNSSSILFGTNRGTIINVNENSILSFIKRKRKYRNFFETYENAKKFSQKLSLHLNSNNERFRRKSYMKNNHHDLDDQHLSLNNIKISQIENLLVERYKLAKEITSERVKKALFDTLALAINPEANMSGNKNQRPNNFPELLEKNKERLIEALNDTPENTLRDKMISILNKTKKEDIIGDIKQHDLLSNLLSKMINELNNEQEILNSINNLIEVFNDHISDLKKLIVNAEEAYIQLKSGRHSLNELSSGERHLLAFLTLFIIEGKERNFLMIDEPEISLNVKWQRHLLPLLNKLAPKTQIIVASHSPSIAKSNTNFLVEMKVGE